MVKRIFRASVFGELDCDCFWSLIESLLQTDIHEQTKSPQSFASGSIYLRWGNFSVFLHCTKIVNCRLAKTWSETKLQNKREETVIAHKIRCANQPVEPKETAKFVCKMVTRRDTSRESCSSLLLLEICVCVSAAQSEDTGMNSHFHFPSVLIIEV